MTGASRAAWVIAAISLAACAGPAPASPTRATANERPCAAVVLDDAQAAAMETETLQRAWETGDHGPLTITVAPDRTTLAVDAADCDALIAQLESRRVQAHEGRAASMAFLVEQRTVLQTRLDAAIAAQQAFEREHGTAARGDRLARSLHQVEVERLARAVATDRAVLAEVDARIAGTPAPVPPFARGQCRPRRCAT